MKKTTRLIFNFILVNCLLLQPILAQDEASSAYRKISSYTQLVLSQWQKQSLLNSSPQSQSGKIFDLNKTFILKENNQSYLNTFIQIKPNTNTSLLSDKGVLIESKQGNFISCLIPLNSLNEVAYLDDVIRIEAARPVYQTLDSVKRCSNINAIHLGQTPNNQAYTGNGVFIGIVDIGFDFTHPNYYDQSGTNYRVQKVWIQTDKTGTPPNGYSIGSEYTTTNAILAKQTDLKTESHGTHTSGIAAGSGYTTPYKGVAPGSDLILVATDLTTTGIMNGIQYIVDNAKNEGKPCCINLSLGSDIGPHDGTTAFDQMIDHITGPGIIVVGAAGNSGARALHLQKTFTENQSDTIKTFLIPETSSEKEILASIWNKTNNPFQLQILIYNKDSQSITESTPWINVDSSNNNYEIATTNNTYQIEFYNQLYAGNHNYNSLIYIATEKNINDPEQIILKIANNQTDTINCWASNGHFSNQNNHNYMNGDSDYSVCEVGGVGKNIISVGAYTTRNKWTNLLSEKREYTPLPSMYEIAFFSGRGPTSDGRIKPDITAPGFGVVSGFNSFNHNDGSTSTKAIAVQTVNSRDYYWGINQGTSMACPVVTGTVALLLEFDPTLTPSQVKSLLTENAFPSSNARINAPNNTYGWGKLNALGSLNSIIPTYIDRMESKNDRIQVSPNPNNGVFKIVTKDELVRITITDLTGSVLYEELFKDSSKEQNIQLTDLMSGIYLLKIETTSEKASSKIVIR